MSPFRQTGWWLWPLVAARNVALHRLKSLIVGSILVFMTALVVVALSLVSAVNQSLHQTVTETLAGDLHVYSSQSDTPVTLLGRSSTAEGKFPAIEDFEAMREALSQIDTIAAVIPISMIRAQFIKGNRIDQISGQLRQARRTQNARRVGALVDQLRAIATQMKASEGASEPTADGQQRDERRQILERAASDELWDGFRHDPDAVLDFIDTKFAPLLSEAAPIAVKLVGTEPAEFARHVHRFEIVRGESIPRGQPGLLINDAIYEERMKHPIARQLDELHRRMVVEGDEVMPEAVLRAEIDQLESGAKLILYDLDRSEREALRGELRRRFERSSDELDDLLDEFFDLTPSNFEERYDLFYELIAPHVVLYEYEIGSTVSLRAMTEHGSVQSVNVQLYGTYAFKGLEDTGFLKDVHVVDLASLGTLRGVQSSNDREELEQLRRDAGVEAIEKSDVEDALFGGGSELVVDAGDLEPSPEDSAASLSASDQDAAQDAAARDAAARDAGAAGDDRSVEPDSKPGGGVKSAAIFLKNPEHASATKEKIVELANQRQLDLHVIEGIEASGIVGKYKSLVNIVLIIAMLFVFLVALAVISNAMVLSTLARTREIGTLRAIGSARGQVISMIVFETLVITLAAGLAGCTIAAIILWWVGDVGIPANGMVLRFLFSGNRLYPSLEMAHVLAGLALITSASVLSALYPAWLAARVSPAVAMREK